MICAQALTLAIALSGSPGAGRPQAAPSAQSALDAAVQLFEDFEDERAAVAFHAFLVRARPGEHAGKAHLYLGLIAVNAIQPDVAKAEFRSALEANPMIDLPRQASPKARLVFAQVHRDLVAELDAATARRAPEPTPVPPAAVAATAVEPSPSAHSHAAAYVLGGATLVLAGLAAYGGIVVLDYNSMVEAGTVSKPTYTLDQLNSARGPASFWAVGWWVAAGLGAAGLAGAVLAW